MPDQDALPAYLYLRLCGCVKSNQYVCRAPSGDVVKPSSLRPGVVDEYHVIEAYSCAGDAASNTTPVTFRVSIPRASPSANTRTDLISNVPRRPSGGSMRRRVMRPSPIHPGRTVCVSHSPARFTLKSACRSAVKLPYFSEHQKSWCRPDMPLRTVIST